MLIALLTLYLFVYIVGNTTLNVKSNDRLHAEKVNWKTHCMRHHLNLCKIKSKLNRRQYRPSRPVKKRIHAPSRKNVNLYPVALLKIKCLELRVEKHERVQLVFYQKILK